MKFNDELTKGEKSLLLYLESRSVDDFGGLNPLQMNSDELETLKTWADSGFINFGRIAFSDVPLASGSTMWVELSDEAWELAHMERRARHKRMSERRAWKKVGED